jgi:hypothetical protein
MSSQPEQITSFLPPVSSPSPASSNALTPLAATLALRDDNGAFLWVHVGPADILFGVEVLFV